MFNLEDHSHRRFNPLTREWVQVSPHRAKRPWQGQVEKLVDKQQPSYDENCYLCPINTRISGDVNPNYKSTYSFINDFGALTPDVPNGEFSDGELFQAKSEKGLCKVICFSPNHSLTIPEMDVSAIRNIVDTWVKEYMELGSLEFINHVQIFENKGAVMGCSNPHPHGQIWAQETVPNEPSKKTISFAAYQEKNNSNLLVDYLEKELEKDERILYQNEHFVALIPFWAIWPFETMILPKRHIKSILDLTDDEKNSFADAYKNLTVLYDNLFETSFPYSAGIHQAPTDGKSHDEWQMHFVFYPPLLRSATVKKFMVGYEMLGNPQRDITPEQAATMLQKVSKVHYKNR